MEAINRRTGLTERQVELLVRCFNGIEMGPPAKPESGVGGVFYDRDSLLNIIVGEAAEAHKDIARKGIWLETFDANAEQPYELDDLTEVVRTLSDEQAQALIWFAQGWWGAARAIGNES